MRLIFWVTALAVLSLTCAKNSTAKTKPKRQLDNIRTPQNLQYSLVLPHSRVAHFRSTSSNRRISNVPRGKLPPYAVQMEPVVQYSQKDPLYDPTLSNLDDATVNKNEIHAQQKILNIHDQSSEASFGPPYGSLPTAPLYSYEPHPRYIEAPEPIIEIIIKESNESLPAPPPQPIQKKKKEPVHVFYVKYSKDPHSKDKVVYEKPIPAITPPSNEEDEHHDEYVTVTPEPLYLPTQTTTLRAIIKPESEVYHSDSSVKVTFGSEGRHYSNHREGNSPHEDHEETAPRPAIALPNAQPTLQTYKYSASPEPQYHESSGRSIAHSSILAETTAQTYRSGPQQAQNRIQFQQPFLANNYQLPRQGPSVSPFRAQPQSSRQTPFAPSPSLTSHPSFPSASPSSHFPNIAPTVPGPINPNFPSPLSRPNNALSFHGSAFGSRPVFSNPTRNNFQSGPQRPFHQVQPQAQTFFDEPKYLQENYHTITTEQVEPPKVQLLPTRQAQNFNPKPSASTSSVKFSENRPQLIPYNQQLPQQRPIQQFDTVSNNPLFSVNPSRSPFFNLKPSPPHIENSRIPFQSSQQQSQQFSFHQGPQPVTRPTVQISSQQTVQSHNSYKSHISPSSSPISQNQFLPQPASSPPLFSFHPQPSPTPITQHSFQQQQQSVNHFQQSSTQTERPPSGQSIFQSESSLDHQQNIGHFIPKGGELVPSISKYEQHITVDGHTPQGNFDGLGESNHPTPSAITSPQQYYQQQQQQQQLQQQQQQLRHQQQQQQQHQQQQQQQHQQQQQQQQRHEQDQSKQQQQQQQLFDAEQEHVRQQLAQNVRKQQEEIQRLQTQLLYNQQLQQQQQQATQFEQNQYNQFTNNYNQQERSRSQPSYVSSTSSPFYQSTSRTVEIKPTTQKYVSSTINSLPSTPIPKKEEKKKPNIELPDEVPDDLRQQLLSSGILDNADISVLDYDKVGETPLESLPPDQLANFFGAGGGQQIASSEHKPVILKPNGDQVESRIDDSIDEDDQEIAASENLATYVAPPAASPQAVEMKVVHFNPNTSEGQNLAKKYVQDDATQIDPVALNDKKYNRYLPLKVNGNQFPLPDVLKGKKITSVVVLAPVQTEELNSEHSRAERAASDSLKGIKFVAGDSLHDLLKKPSKENFNKWLDIEKKTATDEQSVILLVTENGEPAEDREIFMYDITSGNVNKLSGELSNAFVEAAENNSLSKDIEKLAIEGEGTPENFSKSNDHEGEGSENVPLFVDLSGISLDHEDSKVSISSSYSKTKHGRSLRKE